MPSGELRSEWANARKNQRFENVLKRDQVNFGCSGVNKRNLPLRNGRIDDVSVGDAVDRDVDADMGLI
jgi:hypothetical protein